MPYHAAKLVLIFLLLAANGAHSQSEEYIGSATCGGCHQQAFDEWQGSHHQLAMAPALTSTVLGDFDNAEYTYHGITSKFFKEGDEFKVLTDGAAGELEVFDIAYTFGWEPLQQYLIQFENGRMQALNIAWDSRPESEGGQRWFHLRPGESVDHTDVLHWTRFSQNWNTNCAECHSTGLAKNYDPPSNSFATEWREISVGCEACHGPGSGHLDWVNSSQDDPLFGFSTDMMDAHLWQRALGTDTAQKLNDHTEGAPYEQQICAACHSRRFQWEHSVDKPFDETHSLQRVEPGLYHNDGQILEEVYVYGSFLQSKMHGADVTCSNCHNPHTAELKLEGNAVCLQCHSPETFNSVTHHLHDEGSSGSVCVDCHMPETTYMVIDPRRDHSIRVPRPDLSIDSDIPNACNNCHVDQSASWAAEVLEEAFGNPTRNYAENTAGIWRNDEVALNRIFRALSDSQTPNFLKASAVTQLSQFSDPDAIAAATRRLRDPDANIRIAAIEVIGNLPIQQRFQELYPLVNDENAIVRHTVVQYLADAPVERLPENIRRDLEREFGSYERALRNHLDNPGIATRLAGFLSSRGRIDEAIKTYKHANIVEPKFIPATMNLADLYRSLGDEEQSLATLLEAEKIDSSLPDIQYAIGLALVRGQQRDEALDYFQRALALAEERPDYRYALVLSLFESGQETRAIESTLKGLSLDENNVLLTYTLGYFYEKTGNTEEAKRRYERVLELSPSHAGAKQQLQAIR